MKTRYYFQEYNDIGYIEPYLFSEGAYNHLVRNIKTWCNCGVEVNRTMTSVNYRYGKYMIRHSYVKMEGAIREIWLISVKDINGIYTPLYRTFKETQEDLNNDRF